MVHNFTPLNKFTIKPAYPGHLIDEVLDTIVKPKFSVFFSADAANGYWAVPMKRGDEYKTGFVTPHGQYVYLRMGTEWRSHIENGNVTPDIRKISLHAQAGRVVGR